MSVSTDVLSFIPTRSSILKQNSEEQFKAVTYTSYKRKKDRQDKSPTPKLVETTPEVFNIKHAKYEVVKFGMSGFDAQKKEEAKVQLLIQLGAKPRRNKAKNYKLLLEEKKKTKEADKSEMDFQQLGKNVYGKSTAKGKTFDRKRKKEKNDILDSYGTVKAPADK